MTASGRTQTRPRNAPSARRRMGERRVPRRRRSRTDYLDAAVALADRRPATGAAGSHAYTVAHVDIAQVAGVAGVSRSALYRLWETQDSFRADLAQYLAERDRAPWMEEHARHLDPPPPSFDELHRRTGHVLDAAQGDLGHDARLLLRAGIAGHPCSGPVAATLAEQERWRLGVHATALGRALDQVGRCGSGDVTPLDLTTAIATMAEGLGLASHLVPANLLRTAPGSSSGPRGLLGLTATVLLEGLTERGGPAGHPTGAELRPRPPAPPAPHSGRRRHYLDIAGRLATGEGAGDALPLSGGLGFVSLDALARAEGVTRAAFRKLWPTQAAFGLDLAAHLLSRHRESVAHHLHRAGSTAGRGQPTEGGLTDLGQALLGDIVQHRERVSHLAICPQLVLPAFRSQLRHQVEPLVGRVASGLARLLDVHGRRPGPGLGHQQLAVAVLAFVDGTARAVRSTSDAPADRVPTAFAQLLMGLTQPTHGHDRSAS